MCDAVSIVTPTETHFDLSILAIKNNCHVFVEKPISNSLEKGKKIVSFAKQRNKTVQVGHIERFNPAFTTFKTFCSNPLFIESHRLSTYNSRCLDVDVVLDLMIHDIDLVLNLVGGDVLSVVASGACVVTNKLDLVNARLSFKGGVVANLTASRISLKQLRQMRIFEKNFYASLDFDLQSVNKVDVKNKKVVPSKITTKKENNLFLELQSFINSINSGSSVIVSGDDGVRALSVAKKIKKIIEKK